MAHLPEVSVYQDFYFTKFQCTNFKNEVIMVITSSEKSVHYSV